MIKLNIKICPLCNELLRIDYKYDVQTYFCPSDIFTKSHYKIETPYFKQVVVVGDYKIINDIAANNSNIYDSKSGEFITNGPLILLEESNKLLKRIKTTLVFK